MLESVGAALAIFLLRVIGNTLTTLRLIMYNRGRIAIPFVIATLESLLYVVVLGVVVSNLDSIPNLLAYSLGFAAGGAVALWLEKYLIVDFVEITAISTDHGHEIAEAIRELKLGATETEARGGRGEVTVVKSVVERRQLRQCLVVIHDTDPLAFTTTTALRGRDGGVINVQPGLSRLFFR